MYVRETFSGKSFPQTPFKKRKAIFGAFAGLFPSGKRNFKVFGRSLRDTFCRKGPSKRLLTLEWRSGRIFRV